MAITTSTQVHTDYAAAITALNTVITDIYDASVGIIGTESQADSITESERAVMAQAGQNVNRALAILEDGVLTKLAASFAAGSGDDADE